MPVALSFFKDLVASATSLTVDVFTLISSSLEADRRTTVFRRQGWFCNTFKMLDPSCCLFTIDRYLPLPTIPDDCQTFLTCSSQSSCYLLEHTHFTFVGSLFCLLWQLICVCSLVSSGILLVKHYSWRRKSFEFVYGSFHILN